MKILFYDVKKAELNFLLEKVSSKIEPYFFKDVLNESTYVDEKYLDSVGLSIFVSSSLNSKVLSKFKNLKFIFLRCTGYSNVDLNYCKENNIYVFNVPGYGNSTVAEYVFSLLLSLSKKIILANSAIKNGDINQENLCGVELFSKNNGGNWSWGNWQESD